jgi:hypothetical protein
MPPQPTNRFARDPEARSPEAAAERRERMRARLVSPAAEARSAALRALRPLWRDEDFETVLGLARHDPDDTVRGDAAWVLRATASIHTWSRLFDLWCADPLPRHRAWACELAARWGGADDLAAVRRLERDRDGQVQAAAVTAVRRLERA